MHNSENPKIISSLSSTLKSDPIRLDPDKVRVGSDWIKNLCLRVHYNSNFTIQSNQSGQIEVGLDFSSASG